MVYFVDRIPHDTFSWSEVNLNYGRGAAPCGMNCSLCISYQARQYDLKRRGFSRSYCAGCLPRGKNCLFMKSHCDLLANGLVRFCYECLDFPCSRLKNLDKRYRTKYHMSMLANLDFIKTHGVASFLKKETAAGSCTGCGEPLCCHNGLCLNCNLAVLRKNKKYRWNEQSK